MVNFVGSLLRPDGSIAASEVRGQYTIRTGMIISWGGYLSLSVSLLPGPYRLQLENGRSAEINVTSALQTSGGGHYNAFFSGKGPPPT